MYVYPCIKNLAFSKKSANIRLQLLCSNVFCLGWGLATLDLSVGLTMLERPILWFEIRVFSHVISAYLVLWVKCLCLIPPNSYVEALILYVMTFGDEVCWGVIG